MNYDNPGLYINETTDYTVRLVRIETIIANLEICLVNASTNADVQNYSFNDGQSTINTNYRSITEITNAIDAFDKIRQRLISRLGSRVTILRDADTIRRWV